VAENHDLRIARLLNRLEDPELDDEAVAKIEARIEKLEARQKA
jgi:hypothetical protein